METGPMAGDLNQTENVERDAPVFKTAEGVLVRYVGGEWVRVKAEDHEAGALATAKRELAKYLATKTPEAT